LEGSVLCSPRSKLIKRAIDGLIIGISKVTGLTSADVGMDCYVAGNVARGMTIREHARREIAEATAAKDNRRKERRQTSSVL
jgi:hypothetical protein